MNIEFQIIENNETLGLLCGSYKRRDMFAPGPSTYIRSKRNNLTVTFVSDYSNEDDQVGFELHYREEGDDKLYKC